MYVCLSDAGQQTPMYLLTPAIVGCAYMTAVQWVVMLYRKATSTPVDPNAPPPPPAYGPFGRDFFGGVLGKVDALHAPHAPTPFSAFLGSFIGLGGLSGAEWALRASGVAPEDLLMFIASFGALCTLLFAAPPAPLGKPKNVFYGHTVSVLVSLAVHLLLRPVLLHTTGWAIPVTLERALTPALAIGGMVYYKVRDLAAPRSHLSQAPLDLARCSAPTPLLTATAVARTGAAPSCGRVRGDLRVRGDARAAVAAVPALPRAARLRVPRVGAVGHRDVPPPHDAGGGCRRRR